MNDITFPKGQWLITETGIPCYFAYRLKRGTVSIFENGTKISTVTVGEGDKPVLLGVIALVREDMLHQASVQAETDVEVDLLHIDRLRTRIRKDIPDQYRENIDAMVDTILLDNRMKSLYGTAAERAKVVPLHPEGISKEATEILEQITALFEKSPFSGVSSAV